MMGLVDRQLDTRDTLPLSDYFVKRFWLLHEYRLLPYLDANLPHEIHPEDWLGDKAHSVFQSYYALLSNYAERFVDESLQIK